MKISFWFKTMIENRAPIPILIILVVVIAIALWVIFWVRPYLRDKKELRELMREALDKYIRGK